MFIGLSLLPSVIGQIVSTIAGNENSGYLDGLGVNSEFNNPTGVSADVFGNVYVGDYSNGMVRKINASGYVSTLASIPLWSVAADLDGNVFVTSNNYQEILMINPIGNVSTVAGSGWSENGSVDGQGLEASFSDPCGITVDTFGNIYVTDCIDNLIRKINSSYYVTTVAGNGLRSYNDGQGVVATFNNPYAIVADKYNNLYVADTQNHMIRKINATGYVSTLAGNGHATFADDQGTSASFNLPSGIALDRFGNIFVSDGNNNRIRKINTTGYVSTVAGIGVPSFGDGSALTAQFNYPVGLSFDLSGNLYVADFYNNRIRKISGIVANASSTTSSTSSPTSPSPSASSINQSATSTTLLYAQSTPFYLKAEFMYSLFFGFFSFTISFIFYITRKPADTFSQNRRRLHPFSALNISRNIRAIIPKR